MSSGIFDSSILIDSLRGRATAVDFLNVHAASGRLATHLIVAAELFAGARDRREEATIESFLAAIQLHAPTDGDAWAALELYKKYRLSHGVDWPDCQIGATAVRLGVEVYTQNTKHFSAFPGIQIVRPY